MAQKGHTIPEEIVGVAVGPKTHGYMLINYKDKGVFVTGENYAGLFERLRDAAKVKGEEN